MQASEAPEEILTDEARIGMITPREAQVVALVALGLGNKEVARSLHISVETVKEHVHSLLGKAGFASRVGLSVWWVSMIYRAEVHKKVGDLDEERFCLGTRATRVDAAIAAQLLSLRNTG